MIAVIVGQLILIALCIAFVPKCPSCWHRMAKNATECKNCGFRRRYDD